MTPSAVAVATDRMPGPPLPTDLATETGPADRESRRLPVGALLALPALLLGVTAVLRYLSGKSSIDLAIFDQGIWAASRGHSPFSSVIGETLLEDHFGPGMLTFALLYRLVATPVWLLAGQVAAAWSAAWLIARRLRPSLGDRLAALVGAVLLVSPPVAYALLFDVHSVTFAVPFALAAAFALEDGRPRRALLLGLLAASFRVEVGVAVLAAFVALPGVRRGRLVPGVALGAYLIVALYLEKALGHDSYWPIHYGHLGTSPRDALAHPLRLIGVLLSIGTVVKLLPWLATTGFTGLSQLRRLVPVAILALPVVFSRWPGTQGWMFQYGFAPTLLLAVAWIPVLRERPDRARRVVAGSLILAALIGPLTPALLYPAPGEFYAARFWTTDREVDCIIGGIPGDAAVSAGRPITHLTQRQTVYLWPFPFAGVSDRVLPAEHLQHAVPELASEVDYVVVPREEAGKVPAGFVPDGESARYLRFRRPGSTEARPPSCS